MKKRANSEYKSVIDLLMELHKAHPSYSVSRHIATALDGYRDVWGVSDKELLFALQKYKTELELLNVHTPIASDEEVDKIIKEGMSLHTLLDEDEDNGEDY